MSTEHALAVKEVIRICSALETGGVGTGVAVGVDGGGAGSAGVVYDGIEGTVAGQAYG